MSAVSEAVAAVATIQGYVDTYLRVGTLNDHQRKALATDLATLSKNLQTLLEAEKAAAPTTTSQATVASILEAAGEAQSAGALPPQEVTAWMLAAARDAGIEQEMIDSGNVGNPLMPWSDVDYSHFSGTFQYQGRDVNDWALSQVTYVDGQQVSAEKL